MVTTWPAMLPMHMGQLHGYEAILLGVLAFGPFVVLAVVVVIIRRRDVAAEEMGAEEAEQEADERASAREADGG